MKIRNWRKYKGFNAWKNTISGVIVHATKHYYGSYSVYVEYTLDDYISFHTIKAPITSEKETMRIAVEWMRKHPNIKQKRLKGAKKRHKLR